MPGGGDYTAFTWQQLNDIQGNIGKLQQAVESQTAAIGKLEERASSVSEKLHSINVKLAVAAAVAALVVAVAGWVTKEVWDLAKPLIVQKLTAPAVASPVAQQSAKPASSP